jgi:hypothetical protein
MEINVPTRVARVFRGQVAACLEAIAGWRRKPAPQEIFQGTQASVVLSRVLDTPPRRDGRNREVQRAATFVTSALGARHRLSRGFSDAMQWRAEQ